MPNQNEREALLQRLATISEEIGRISAEREAALKPIDQRLDELGADRDVTIRALLEPPEVPGFPMPPKEIREKLAAEHAASNGVANGEVPHTPQATLPLLRAHDGNGHAKPNRFAKPAPQLGPQSQQILNYFHGDVLKTADIVEMAVKDGMGKSSCYGVLSILVKQKHLSKAGPGEYYRPERK